jgi:MraZ protein
MFAGSASAKLDEKGRFVLPAKFRAGAGTTLYLAKADQGQLQLLTQEAYDVEIAQHDAAFAAGLDPDRWLKRSFMQTVESVTPDTQARIAVIERLRAHASMRERGELFLIGMHDRLEVWDAEVYGVADEAQRQKAGTRGGQ